MPASNGMQKTSEACFARWMTIQATPGSVLWLLAADDAVNNRPVQTAVKAGIAAERIIFAPKAANAHHLARTGFAGSVPRHLPYGALDRGRCHHHGSAGAHGSGQELRPRVSATAPLPPACRSLPAVGLTTTSSAPSVSAKGSREPSGDPPSLKDKREGSAPRDIPGLARRLEELFWQMQGEAERGETPTPDLNNLDAYYEIGAELVQTLDEFEDDASYRRR